MSTAVHKARMREHERLAKERNAALRMAAATQEVDHRPEGAGVGTLVVRPKTEPGCSSASSNCVRARTAGLSRATTAAPSSKTSLLRLMQRRPQRHTGSFAFELHQSLPRPDPRTTDYRDSSMPDSPDTKLSAPSVSPLSVMPPVTGRPLSTSSSLSGLNGSHSPHSSLNGRTPSPPSLGGVTGQQLPPACGARQLSKLKRFLTTLQQFGSDISPEIGERVRSLVLGLVNSHLSIEEFHAKLQEATNFPLRPFVIPFLKANLPLLQRELLHCARLAKQSPQQYLAHNEHILFDPLSPAMDAQDLTSDINENGKRRSPDRPKENGVDPHMENMHPAKRPHTLSPAGNAPRVSPGNAPYAYHSGPLRLEDISMNREMRERERIDRERIERERAAEREQRERERQYSSSSSSFNNVPSRPEQFDHPERAEDDWKHVENMLHCIMGMVDKCKRMMTSLQERHLRDREEMAAWMRRRDGNDGDVKKRDMLLRTDDRMDSMKRRAEEAVNEVKRQAVAELQKAVAAAEAKASEMVSTERAKMEQVIREAKKQVQEDVSINQQEDSSESCWNCGRKASETCSGCNVARYCGAFCQHKDWENHHRVCGQTVVTRERISHPDTPAVPSATSTVTTAAPTSQPQQQQNQPRVPTPTEAAGARTHSPAGVLASATHSTPPVSPAHSATSSHSRSAGGSRSSSPAETKTNMSR